MDIGIITLHRVVNYGSALQAYALQHYIEQHGLGKVELIDYIYPNSFHKKYQTLMSRFKLFYCVEIRDMYFRGRRKRIKRFDGFYKKYFHLSLRQYKSIDAIMEQPPCYDIYMSGSDQLWNVKTLHNDPVPYCEFAPQRKPRIAFSSSFSLNSLPEEYCESVRDRLNKYQFIGVREQSSLKIVENLGINKDIVVKNTCDPTLLLGAGEYLKLACDSEIRINEEYILVYALKYAYNPEPALSSLIRQVKEKTGLMVVVIDNYNVQLGDGDRLITGVGPCEFCWLFAHAKYVIASSFHAVMFSIINRIPFVVIGPEKEHPDSRIKDVLLLLGMENRYVYSNEDDCEICLDNPYSKDVEHKLKSFVDESKKFLDFAIENA